MNKMRHKCTSCGKDFANRAALDSHIDKHHLDETLYKIAGNGLQGSGLTNPKHGFAKF